MLLHYKMRQKKFLKPAFLLLALTALSALVIFTLNNKSSSFVKNQFTTANDPISYKVGKLFYHLQKKGVSLDDVLKKVGPLEQSELNEAYQKAIDRQKYALAIQLYHLGASDCYQEGRDILWASLNAADFDTANTLLGSNYKIAICHIDAIRSLLNVDQSNWVFIYQGNEDDQESYSKYQRHCHAIAQKMIALYKKQNPIKQSQPSSSINPSKEYAAVFGEHPLEEFKQELQKVLQEGYSFDIAKHGSQKRLILVDKFGKKIGILKSKNELLAQAFDLDHFAKVPPVTEVFLPEQGLVVIQKWVPDAKMLRDYAPKKGVHIHQSDHELEDLHHIRVLDIRLGNSDRNRSNILVTHSDHNHYMIPIDHDLLMFYIPNDLNWEASYLSVPFTEAAQNYIQKIDIQKDQEIMRALAYTDEEIHSMKVRTVLLKMAVEKKLSLKETDMLFRFYYYDFVEKAKHISLDANEEQFRHVLSPYFEQTVAIVEQPIEVWKLIGNTFEFYL